MKRVSLAILAVGLALVGPGLPACTDDLLAPREAAPLAGATGPNLDLDMSVVQSVTGNAHLMDSPADRTVTFNILKRADGTVDGWYHASTRGPGGAQIAVRMECLHVVGNRAWAMGTIVDAVDPNNIGRPCSLTFVDNGEGLSATPDEIGGSWVDSDCATEPNFSTRAVTIGNLQIRG